MALDFTVVITVRQRFGEAEPDDYKYLETEAPFVGSQKDYEFRCPGVDSSQQAILLFQSQGAIVQQPLEINGRQIYGGVPRSVDMAKGQFEYFIAQWSGNVMLVEPGVLQENNVLRIRALEIIGIGKLDSFIIDNVVVLFKTREGLPPINA